MGNLRRVTLQGPVNMSHLLKISSKCAMERNARRLQITRYPTLYVAVRIDGKKFGLAWIFFLPRKRKSRQRFRCDCFTLGTKKGYSRCSPPSVMITDTKARKLRKAGVRSQQGVFQGCCLGLCFLRPHLPTFSRNLTCKEEVVQCCLVKYCKALFV